MMIILVRRTKTATTSTAVSAVGSGLLAAVYKGGCSRAHGSIIHRTVICCSDDSPSKTNFMSRTRCMSSDASSPQLSKELDLYSKKKQTSVSLRALMESGQGLHLYKSGLGGASTEDAMKVAEKIVIQIACFLHRELPVRVAHRAVKLEASPLFMKSVNIQNVCSWYKTSFAQLRSCPVPSDREKEELFAKVIESVYERHSSTLITMAKGAHELRNMVKQDVTSFADSNDIQKRLDEFYMSRIGIRMLIGQYLALRKMSSIDGQMVGLISLNASPYEIASQAARDAAYVCIRTHGDAPEVTIHGRTDLTIPYVSSHLSYILLELLKNSMRATVETHGIDKMPPIKIVIADGEDNEDVVLKVSDEGGGIKRSNIDRIWSYLYTTAHPSVLQRMLDDSSNDMKDFDTASPLAGLGYGLPISRNYARIFDGDLKIMSMEGYGTDSFIYLPRLGSANMYGNRYEDDEDRPSAMSSAGNYKMPDRDFYRKNFNIFSSVYLHFQNRLYVRRFEDRRYSQPHYCALANTMTSYANVANPADGVCGHFLRRGFTKPNKIQFNCAVWSSDARWLVLGTQIGDLALWEGEALKVHKVQSIPAHKEFYGDGSDRVREQIPITAMAWKHHGDILATGDNRGLIHYCDETFRQVTVTKDAHTGAIRGLSFSPLDSKLISCSDDGRIHMWAGGRDKPEQVLQGHQSDIKCVDWHPYRSLIVSGSRDSSIRLWDAKAGKCVSVINSHKKQVNCCSWNSNGNWLASASMDGLVKLYDIRVMKELEVWRGHNSEVCKIAWHPIHETLLLSGGYNGSLIYWLAGQSQTPHTVISDAHRQSIDVIAWHPSGHLVGTSSHDSILKFWCREPPGSKLELPANEAAQEYPPVYAHGPIAPGAPSIILPKSGPSSEGGASGGGFSRGAGQSSSSHGGGHQSRYAPRSQGGGGSSSNSGPYQRDRKRNRDS